MTVRLGAARVLWADGSLRPGVVVIDGGRIASVESLSGPAPDRTVSPGLVDLQLNGLGDCDVATGTQAAVVALGHALAARGTTGWCPTLCSRPLDWYAGWFAGHPEPPPGEIGIHLEGPFLVRPGAHPTAVLRPPDHAWLDALPPRVRLITLAPEMPGAIDAIRSLRRRGVVVSIGHTEATYEVAEAAADAGATMVTHLFNGMPPLHHRRPGVVAAGLGDPRLVPGVIGDGIHVDPVALRLAMTGRRTVLVSDSVASRGLVVADGAARLADGTLAGSIIVLADAVRTAVAAGVPLGAALVAATVAPAQVIGAADRGVLAPGARADVVVWDADIAVDEVWVEGQQVA